MQATEIGRTGIALPRIGLGTWRYRGSSELLRRGIELGATFVDTAESYGTETVVGEAVSARRHDVFLASKVSPRHFRRKDLIAAAERSLKLMTTDYLDLYQLHWPNYTVPIEETMRAMESLVDSGKVRFIGVSNFMLKDLQKAEKAMSEHKIVSNQVRYNLIDRTIEFGLLEYCQSKGITVIAHSPFHTNLAGIRQNDPHNVIDALATRHRKTAGQVVLNWCISKPGVVTIPKSESLDHIKENCDASDFRLSEEDLRQLDSRITFSYRSRSEILLRRFARHLLQHAGRNQ